MNALTAVLLFAAWTLALAMIYVVPRLPPVLLGKRPANAWTRGNPSIDAPVIVRAQHAHLNALENLPIFLTVVAAALLTDRGAVIDPLAPYVLYARIGQSLIHLMGTAFLHVLLRATFYFVQVALMAYMIWALLH